MLVQSVYVIVLFEIVQLQLKYSFVCLIRCIPITGYLPYEILGSVMYEFIHCDDLESIAKSFESRKYVLDS